MLKDDISGITGEDDEDDEDEVEDEDEDEAPDEDIDPSTIGVAPVDHASAGLGEQSFANSLIYGGEQKSEDAVWIEQLLSDNNLLTKTNITATAIPLISWCLVKAAEYVDTPLLDYINNYLKLRISLSGRGRDQIVQMALRQKGNDDW